MCVGALAIADALHHLDADLLSWWCVLKDNNLGTGCLFQAACREVPAGFEPPLPAIQRRLLASSGTAHWKTESLLNLQQPLATEIHPNHFHHGTVGEASPAPDPGLLCSRIAERQTRSGGLNGRPEKLQDVCYSWWCLSALAILRRQHWIDEAALTRFILYCQARACCLPGTLSANNERIVNRLPSFTCFHGRLDGCRRRRFQGLTQIAALQDEHDGGISDRPEDAVDVFHTFFGIAGLSLLGYKGLQQVDPAFALPVDVVQRIQKRQSNCGAAKGM